MFVLVSVLASSKQKPKLTDNEHKRNETQKTRDGHNDQRLYGQFELKRRGEEKESKRQQQQKYTPTIIQFFLLTHLTDIITTQTDIFPLFLCIVKSSSFVLKNDKKTVALNCRQRGLIYEQPSSKCTHRI